MVFKIENNIVRNFTNSNYTTGEKQVKMPNIENLKRGKKTQFKPGQSGNPKGRPKLPAIYKDSLIKIMLEKEDGVIILEKILRSLRDQAIEGNVRAIQEILDRIIGKPQQFIDHTSDGEKINIPIIKWVNGIDKDENK